MQCERQRQRTHQTTKQTPDWLTGLLPLPILADLPASFVNGDVLSFLFKTPPFFFFKILFFKKFRSCMGVLDHQICHPLLKKSQKI